MEIHQISDNANFIGISHNGRYYVTMEKAAEMLGFSVATFEQSFWQAKQGRRLDAKFWELLRNSGITFGNSRRRYYPFDLLQAYIRKKWKKQDYIYRVLHKLDSEVEAKGLNSVSEILKQDPSHIRRYLKCEKIPTYETAKQINRRLNNGKFSRTNPQS